MKPAFRSDHRFKLVMAGERAAKSWTGAAYALVQYMLKRAVTGEPQRIWLVGHDYSASTEEFNRLRDLLELRGELSPRHVFQRDGGRDYSYFVVYEEPGNMESRIMLTVETITGETPAKVARMAVDGILGCEVAQWSEELFWRVNARLAQRQGWLWASGSFESSTDWLSKLWRRWLAGDGDSASFGVPSWTNQFVYPAGRTDPEIRRLERVLPRNLWLERVVGEAAPPTALVYDEFDRAVHVTTSAAYDATLPVHVWIDPGYRGAYAVLAIQHHHNTVWIVDELYQRGKTHRDMIAMMRARPWGAAVRDGVVDIAGTQHHAAESAEEVWRQEHVYLSAKRIRLADGIDRVRSCLRSDGSEVPAIRVNPACRGLISEMGAGPAPFDGGGPWCYKTAHDGSITDVPQDGNDHSCDALAYGLVSMLGYVEHSKVTGPVSYWNDQGPSWLAWERTAGARAKRPRYTRRWPWDDEEVRNAPESA